jgi:carbamoyltransferase
MYNDVLVIQKQGPGSICLIRDGDILFHISDERISRNKYSRSPFGALKELHKFSPKIGYVYFTGYDFDKSLNDFYYSFLISEKLIDHNVKWFEPQANHHIAHAATGFYNSGFDTALCIVMDGYGSQYKIDGKLTPQYGCETSSVYLASYPDNFVCIHKNILVDTITQHKFKEACDSEMLDKYPYPTANNIELRKDYDIGLMYQAVSRHINFSHNDCGKTMGLSAYGSHNDNLPEFISKDGDKFYSNMNIFYDKFSLNAERYPIFKEELNTPDICYALQKATETLGTEFVKRMVKETGVKNVVISGGVGQNILLNYKLVENLDADINLYIEPNCEDEGNSIGMAKLLWHSISKDKTIRPLTNVYGGTAPDYSQLLLKDNETCSDTDYNIVTDLLLQGNIVCIFQGKSEWGRRGLGNRSILLDPRILNGKDIINKIKKREWFRPFAGTILLEECHKWFDMKNLKESPYMMYGVNALDGTSEIVPSIIHKDNTCRIQTVTEEQNLHFYNLIKKFNDKTKVPILFNTSFNIAGEPVVESLYDALDTMRRSEMEYLYLPEIGKLVHIPNIKEDC